MGVGGMYKAALIQFQLTKLSKCTYIFVWQSEKKIVIIFFANHENRSTNTYNTHMGS